MAESTLTLTWSDLLAEAGGYLGWGRTAANWSAKKSEELKRIMESALRRFYFQSGHAWTFLKPVADVQLVAGQATAPLPDDFGGFEGVATVRLSGSGGYYPLRQAHDEQIRAMYAANRTVSGRPTHYAELQAHGPTAQGSNRSELYVYPLPNADYLLSVRYGVLPNYLTNSAPYPYGGAAHAETMKAAVRAAAELYLDSIEGPQAANYKECLQTSLDFDRRHEPKSLGINSDASDWLLHNRGRGHWPDGLWHPLGIGYLDTATYQ